MKQLFTGIAWGVFYVEFNSDWGKEYGKYGYKSTYAPE
jgi:hypothetical protein